VLVGEGAAEEIVQLAFAKAMKVASETEAGHPGPSAAREDHDRNGNGRLL
jgi:hypothetical protein